MKKINKLYVNVSNKTFYYLTSNWCISKLVLILLNIFYIFRNLKQLKNHDFFHQIQGGLNLSTAVQEKGSHSHNISSVISVFALLVLDMIL